MKAPIDVMCAPIFLEFAGRLSAALGHGLLGGIRTQELSRSDWIERLKFIDPLALARSLSDGCSDPLRDRVWRRCHGRERSGGKFLDDHRKCEETDDSEETHRGGALHTGHIGAARVDEGLPSPIRKKAMARSLPRHDLSACWSRTLIGIVDRMHMTRFRTRPMAAMTGIAATLVAVLAFVSPAAARDYGLTPGDVVEMSVVGLPDLRQRSQVDVDGNVSLPLAGSVKAAGLTVAELRERLQDLIGRKAVRRRSDDGREIPVIIEPDEVTLDIVEYRPVYVNGDVSKPGEVRFRSSLTVRQAVSLAGGYDLMRFRLDNPFLQAADLEGDVSSLSAQYALSQATIARLEAELRGDKGIGSGDAAEPLARRFVAEIRSGESQRFVLRQSDLALEATTLRSLVDLGNKELSSLEVQVQKEEEGTKVDEDDLARITGLFDRGTTPITRVVDTRRILLLGATRLLQTKVQAERVRRERELDQNKLAKLESERRLEILRDLQAARVDGETIKSRLNAARAKLLYTSTVRSQLVEGTGGRPNVSVFRPESDGRRSSRIQADEDTILRPGDLVEVSLVAFYQPPVSTSSAPVSQPPSR